MTSVRQFFGELRRRRVIRAAGLYILVAWMVIQVGEATFDSMALPDWSLRLVIVLATLGFPLVLVLAWAYDVQPTSDQKIVRTPATPEPRQPIESIAVLPFADMSPDGDQEYFADGIAEELLNTLTNCCRHLRVPARSSSFAYKGVDADAREIGARLGVDGLIEGSVRKSGDTVRITTQLVDVRDGFHIWSESYDRQLVDLFAVQDEIAHAVVDALDLSMTEHDRSAIATSPPADVRAYEFYLKGRQFFGQSRKTSLEYAQEMYHGAIDIDPEYALAWAGLAASAAQAAMLYPGAPSAEEDIAKADAASAKALDLDPTLADAHAARGFALFLMQKYEEAEAAFEKAIQLDPQHVDAHFFYGRTCFQQGRFEDALRLFTAASEIGENYEAAFFAAQSLEAMDRSEEAAGYYRASLEASETHMALNPDDPRAATFRAVAHGRLDEREDGLKWAERALSIDPADAGVKYNVACLYAVEGEVNRAVDILEEAVAAGFSRRAWVENDPDLDALREDARFQGLLERL